LEAPRLRVEPGRAAVVELPWRARLVATLPPGVGEAGAVAFVHVAGDYTPPAPRLSEALRAEAEGLGLRDALVFLTAADTDRVAWSEVEAGGGRVWVYATIGLSPPACPGGPGRLYEPLRAATINVAVVVDSPLEPAGALDLLRVVAEAKAAASSELLLRCPPLKGAPLRPLGTVTDAVAVLWRPGPGGAEVSGHATTIGGPVGLEVYRLIVEEGLARLGPEGLASNALGLGPGELAAAVRRVYERAPVPGVRGERVEEAAAALIRGWLRDPNVQALIVAAREADIHASAGAVPGLGRGEFEADTPRIVADELLGMTLASYLAGARGVLAMYWVERLKKEERLIPEPPMFEDDIVSAIVASALARILDRLLGTEPEVGL
jgi:alpha-ribazole phosphatase CobZ